MPLLHYLANFASFSPRGEVQGHLGMLYAACGGEAQARTCAAFTASDNMRWEEAVIAWKSPGEVQSTGETA